MVKQKNKSFKMIKATVTDTIYLYDGLSSFREHKGMLGKDLKEVLR